MEIEIGTQFYKPLGKGKHANCMLIDIVKRISTVTGKEIGIEYWAKADNYAEGSSFEVSKHTIIAGLIPAKNKI